MPFFVYYLQVITVFISTSNPHTSPIESLKNMALAKIRFQSDLLLHDLSAAFATGDPSLLLDIASSHGFQDTVSNPDFPPVSSVFISDLTLLVTFFSIILKSSWVQSSELLTFLFILISFVVRLSHGFKYHVCDKNSPIFIPSWGLSHKFQVVNPLSCLKSPLGYLTNCSDSSFPKVSTYSFPCKRRICHPPQSPLPSSSPLMATPFFWLFRWKVWESSLIMIFLLVVISQENLLAGPLKHSRFSLLLTPTWSHWATVWSCWVPQ